MKLETERYRILVDDRWLRFPEPILHARKMNGMVFVIFDYMNYDKEKPASNLAAFDEEGKELWRAENPTALTSDAYTSFLDEEILRVGNFAGYSCEIDPYTGRIIESEFTK